MKSPRCLIDVTDVVHVATLNALWLRDAIVMRGRTDVVAALDVEDVRSTFLDEVVQLTQVFVTELGKGSSLERELAAIKRDDIGRAASVVIAAYDDFMRLGVDDTNARG